MRILLTVATTNYYYLRILLTIASTDFYYLRILLTVVTAILYPVKLRRYFLVTVPMLFFIELLVPVQKLTSEHTYRPGKIQVKKLKVTK